MSIQCRAGGQKHNHDTVAQVKAHFAKELGSDLVAVTLLPNSPTRQERNRQEGYLPTAEDEALWAAQIQARELAEDVAAASAKLLQWSRGARREGLRGLRDAEFAGEPDGRLHFETPQRQDWSEVRRLQRQLPDLAHAYYAVNFDGKLRFFRVDKPREGRWAGRTFVKEQASDELYPVRGLERTLAIFKAIAADPKAAMILYGKKLKRCGHCHRALTDDKVNGDDGLSSLDRGIGPVCYAKMGW